MYYKFLFMNKIFVFFLIFTLNCFAQNKDFSLQENVISDGIFSGIIDEKHDITIYLKKFKNSDSHKGFYSLKGWYYYDKYELKIPIVGIYSPYGKLTLYVLNDTKTEEEIANLTYGDEEAIFWDQIEEIEKIVDFKEKFVFDTNGEEKNWISNNKTLKLGIYNIDKIYQITSSSCYFLHFQDQMIDLRNYGMNSDEMKILNTSIEQNQKKCILSFSDAGSHNYMGMCGGAIDNGLIYLCFDKNNSLTEFKYVFLDNCKMFIFSEELIKNESIIKYKVTKEDKKTDIITVDLKSVKITIN